MEGILVAGWEKRIGKDMRMLSPVSLVSCTTYETEELERAIRRAVGLLRRHPELRRVPASRSWPSVSA